MLAHSFVAIHPRCRAPRSLVCLVDFRKEKENNVFVRATY